MVTALCLLMLLGNGAQAQYADHRNREVDSLEMLLQSPDVPQGEELLRIYIDLMWGYLQTDGSKSEAYARKAMAQSYRVDGKNARVDALRLLGMNAFGRGDYDEALGYYDHALSLTDSMRSDSRYTEKDIDNNLSSLYGNIGNLYNMQDKLLLAIDYYQKALPIFEKYRWLESTAILYNNVGELYLSMGNYKEAENNFLQAISVARESGDSLIIATPSKGIPKVYLAQGNYEQAEAAARVAYDYFSRHKDEELGGYVDALLPLARVAQHRGDVQQTHALAEELLALVKDAPDGVSVESVADVYNLCCELVMENKQWSQALEYAQKALAADEDETYSDIGTYVMMAQIYTELGDKEQAKRYAEKIHTESERFATEYYQNGISQMEVRYETEKKQLQIEELQQEQRWMKRITWLSVIALLLALGLLIFVVRWFRLKRRHAEALAKIDGETSERVRIARDLHDRMGALLTGVKMNLSLFARNTADQTACDNAMQLTDEAVHEMRDIVHHLMPESLRRFGLRTALESFCQTMPTVHFSFVGEDLRMERRKEEALYYIAHELVNNAVKNAGATSVAVSLQLNSQEVILQVSDNGKGINPHDSGFGMESIAARVKALGGRLELNSKPDAGSEFKIEVPNS